MSKFFYAFTIFDLQLVDTFVFFLQLQVQVFSLFLLVSMLQYL